MKHENPTNYARRQNDTTMKASGIHAHVDNRRPLTAQACQCKLKGCTGAGAQMNKAKRKGTQTPDRCTGPSVSQNTAGWVRITILLTLKEHKPSLILLTQLNYI